MDLLIKFLEQLYDEKITEDFDRIIPVIGDEGMGKSTLMLQLVWFWLGIIPNQEQTVENVMDSIAWDLEEFKEMLGNKPQYAPIVVHDAARVLSRKKAMHGDQIEVEEDLLDARFGNYLVLLGYQEFDLVPTMLATRRAKNMLYIPKRGWVHGHNEAAIRKRYDSDSWPDPVLRDSYSDLEGTDLWDTFTSEDQRRKQERIEPDQDTENESEDPRDVADQVIEDGLESVISIHGGHNKPYIDADLIEMEYDISGRKAKKVKKVLSRDVNLAEYGMA
jgi:hypothetical protein